MLTGTVTEDLLPVLLLPVAGQAWQAHIDTGFNGDLELPDPLRSACNARYVCRCLSVLAGGQSTFEDLFEVDFPFDDQIMMAEATFVPGTEILVGTHLMRNYRLEIDFPNRTVRLEQARS